MELFSCLLWGLVFSSFSLEYWGSFNWAALDSKENLQILSALPCINLVRTSLHSEFLTEGCGFCFWCVYIYVEATIGGTRFFWVEYLVCCAFSWNARPSACSVRCCSWSKRVCPRLDILSWSACCGRTGLWLWPVILRKCMPSPFS